LFNKDLNLVVYKNKRRAGRMVKCLPGTCEPLGLILSNTKKEKRRKPVEIGTGRKLPQNPSTSL
jgi:hypothetical protein